MSFKAEILPEAHDEKNARRGYQLDVVKPDRRIPLRGMQQA
ncbi:MAG: hypothetical protein ABSF14_14000 [Terriglobia bacterium]|jgi:hypothetical protein